MPGHCTWGVKTRLDYSVRGPSIYYVDIKLVILDPPVPPRRQPVDISLTPLPPPLSTSTRLKIKIALFNECCHLDYFPCLFVFSFFFKFTDISKYIFEIFFIWGKHWEMNWPPKNRWWVNRARPGLWSNKPRPERETKWKMKVFVVNKRHVLLGQTFISNIITI